MALHSRFATLIWALLLSVLSGHRVMAQTTESEPILKVEGTLQADDETLNDGSFYDVHEFTGQADQTVTILLESEAFDAYLTLEDNQGNSLATNDDINSTTTNAALVTTLPTTGRYRVIANTYQIDEQGPYRLTIESTPEEQPNSLLNAAEVMLLKAVQRLEKGEIRLQSRDIQSAFTLWEEALALFQDETVRSSFPLDSHQGEATVFARLSLIYGYFGDYAQAADFSQQALEISQEIGNRELEAASLSNLGFAYTLLGDDTRAADFFQQALEILQEIDDFQGEALLLGNLGATYIWSDNYDRSIDFQQQALKISREIGDPLSEANALGSLGASHIGLENYTLAIDFLQKALEVVRQLDNKQHFEKKLLEVNLLGLLGASFWMLDDLTKAEHYFRLVSEVQTLILSENLNDTNRLSLLDSQQYLNFLWQMTLMDQGRPTVALEASERGRAQALAVKMAQVGAFELPSQPSFKEIKDIAIQQDVTLVEYSVLPYGRILIWVIQPDGTIHSIESDAAALDESLIETADIFANLGPNGRGGDLPETPLSALVQDTQAVLTRGGSSGSQSPISRQQLDTYLQELHEVLIKPIAQWLPKDEKQRVVFIPHQELFGVPFAALRDKDGNYLIQKHTILTASSIQSLELARQHRLRIRSLIIQMPLLLATHLVYGLRGSLWMEFIARSRTRSSKSG